MKKILGIAYGLSLIFFGYLIGKEYNSTFVAAPFYILSFLIAILVQEI